jgi:hypothetical protein
MKSWRPEESGALLIKRARCGGSTVIPALGGLRKDDIQVQVQPGLHSETLSQKKKKTQNCQLQIIRAVKQASLRGQ